MKFNSIFFHPRLFWTPWLNLHIVYQSLHVHLEGTALYFIKILPVKFWNGTLSCKNDRKKFIEYRFSLKHCVILVLLYHSFSKFCLMDHLFWHFSTTGTKRISKFLGDITTSLNGMTSGILVPNPPPVMGWRKTHQLLCLRFSLLTV